MAPDPLDQFRRWHAEWAVTGPPDPAAAVLATTGDDGRPSARFVNVVAVDEGFVFYTSHRSRKAADVAARPWAALVFGWLGHDRQVRVEGPVARVAEGEADERFAGLPRRVQLVVWASDQRSVVPDRAALEAAVAEVAARFGDGAVPRPGHWGGYRLVPETVELWQGADDHLHERFRYRRGGGGWVVERLAP